MQALIPFLVTMGLASAGHLTLLPYAYLVDPLPVYHQAQNTRTGEHAYSYAGGPSAKEEVKGADGVTRGSYSYVDAHGILQSVFYVADEGGFRVAATNLPTSGDLPVEPVEIQLAKRALFDEQEKARSSESHSRRRRSTDEGSSENSDGEDQVPAEFVSAAVLANSVTLPKLPLATSSQNRVDISGNLHLGPLAAEVKLEVPVLQHYEALDAVALPVHVPIATSHQSRVQVHSNVRAEGSDESNEKKIEAIQSPVQPLLAAAVQEYALPVLTAVVPSFEENRLQIHKNLGLKGPNQQDAVKINTEVGAILQPGLLSVAATVLTKESSSVDAAAQATQESAPTEITSASAEAQVSAASAKESSEETTSSSIPAIPAVPAIPTIPEVSSIPAIPAVPAVQTLPVAAIPTAHSSQTRTQIHRNTKLQLSTPLLTQPSFYVEAEPLATFVQPIATTYQAYLHSIPLAHSSQYRTQIHSSEKIESADAVVIDSSNQETK